MTRLMHIVIDRAKPGYFEMTEVTLYTPDGKVYEGSGYSLASAMSEVADALDVAEGVGNDQL